MNPEPPVVIGSAFMAEVAMKVNEMRWRRMRGGATISPALGVALNGA
jgi:hypothetical protein